MFRKSPSFSRKMRSPFGYTLFVIGLIVSWILIAHLGGRFRYARFKHLHGETRDGGHMTMTSGFRPGVDKSGSSGSGSTNGMFIMNPNSFSLSFKKHSNSDGNQLDMSVEDEGDYDLSMFDLPPLEEGGDYSGDVVTLGPYEDALEEFLPRKRTILSDEALNQEIGQDSLKERFVFLGMATTTSSDTATSNSQNNNNNDDSESNNSGPNTLVIPQDAFQNFPLIRPHLIGENTTLDEKNEDGHYDKLVDALDKQYEYMNQIRDTLERIKNSHPRLEKLRANACILILCENADLPDILRTLASFEFTFNSKYQYPYVFLSVSSLDDGFRSAVRSIVLSDVSFGTIPYEHWAIPRDISRAVLHEKLKEHRHAYLFGDSQWHRQMFRYKSAFLHKHPLLAKYRYYWKIGATSQFGCMIRYDPLLYLAMSRKTYGFITVAQDSLAANEQLFNVTVNFIKDQGLPLSPFLREVFYDPEKNDLSGNMFETVAEIADLEFFRSRMYERYIDQIDKSKGVNMISASGRFNE